MSELVLGNTAKGASRFGTASQFIVGKSRLKTKELFPGYCRRGEGKGPIDPLPMPLRHDFDRLRGGAAGTGMIGSVGVGVEATAAGACLSRGCAVGFYSRVIFPRLCDFVLNNPFVARYRRELLAEAHGEVLEIGFGTGLNLEHYPAQVSKLVVIDPNVGMHRLAERRIKRSTIEVDRRVLSSERLPFADGTFDCVVSTFTLCSIEDVAQALGEVHRVLKPGGRFLFLEHGLSPEPKVQKWQRRLNWLEMHLADGCQLVRNIQELVTAPPFSAVEIKEGYGEKMPKTHGYLYRGLAVK